MNRNIYSKLESITTSDLRKVMWYNEVEHMRMVYRSSLQSYKVYLFAPRQLKRAKENKKIKRVLTYQICISSCILLRQGISVCLFKIADSAHKLNQPPRDRRIFMNLWEEDLLVNIFTFTEGVFDIHCHCKGKAVFSKVKRQTGTPNLK